jgi:hypothetical protein
MIHEGVLRRRRLIEGYEKLDLVLDKHDVLPAHEVGWWRRVVDRKDAERCAMNMEGMRHADRKDLPNFRCSDPDALVDPGGVMGFSIDAHDATHAHLHFGWLAGAHARAADSSHLVAALRARSQHPRGFERCRVRGSVPGDDRAVAIPILGEWPAPIDWIAITSISVGVYVVSGGPLPGNGVAMKRWR